MATALQNLTDKLAKRFEIADGSDLMATLKNTAFKGNVNDSQMTALLIVANQYGLNPWTKEIYAFPDRQNGIVPIVGVDGWARILNENPNFDGIEFDLEDRSKPISVTEYMSECFRDMGPWKTHPKRMLRHKAMIQCARLAFGFTGIYDQDEADRIVETQREPVNVTPKQNVIDVSALITSEQKEMLIGLIDATGTSTEKLLTAYGHTDISEMTKEQADNAISILNSRLDKQQESDGEDVPL